MKTCTTVASEHQEPRRWANCQPTIIYSLRHTVLGLNWERVEGVAAHAGNQTSSQPCAGRVLIVRIMLLASAALVGDGARAWMLHRISQEAQTGVGQSGLTRKVEKPLSDSRVCLCWALRKVKSLGKARATGRGDENSVTLVEGDAKLEAQLAA